MDPPEAQGILPSTQDAISLLENGSQPLPNTRQERFAHNRANGQGFADAYLNAGYKKCSRAQAASSGATLIKRARGRVQERVDYLVALVGQQAQVTRQRVIDEIAHIGLGNLSDIVEWDQYGAATVKASKDLTPAQAALVKKIKLDKGKSLEIETHSKLDALDKLARIYKAYPDDRGGPDTGVTIVIMAPEKMSNEDWLIKYGTAVEVGPG